MSNFVVTRQNDLFPLESNGNNLHGYKIQDQILSDCIGRGNGHDPERVSGFNYGKNTFGYILLSYFTARALGFKRLPFCEDRIYASALKSDADSKTLEKLDGKRVESICNELTSIYQHTQTKLKRAGSLTVNLRREIRNVNSNDGYVETLIRLKKSADLLNLKEIQIEMDTLNSFGDEGHYRDCNGVSLELQIPIEDVLYCSNLIENTEGEYQSKNVETGEWIIVNRSPNGVVSLPTSSILYKDSYWKDTKPFPVEQDRSFINNPIILRSRYEPEVIYSRASLHSTFKQRFVCNAIKWLCKI